MWCCDEAPGFAPTRAQDKAVVGNIVAAMTDYAAGKLGADALRLDAVDRLIVDRLGRDDGGGRSAHATAS